MGEFPRTIFTYWHQGFEEAPRVVKSCVARLIAKNAGWEIHTLDRDSIHEFIRPSPISSNRIAKLSLAHRSDLLRTQLLIDYGGVWVDPTVFVSQSFDDWLPEKSDAGLFMFSRPGRDRVISNWFIAAVPQHPVLTHFFDELCAYWETNKFRNLARKPSKFERQLRRIINRNLEWPRFWFSWPARKVLRLAPYMVYHYLFYRVVKENEELWEIFSQMPIVSADGPHMLQRIGLGSQFGLEAEQVINNMQIPVHKLTYKKNGGEISRGSVLEHLVTAAESPIAGRLG